MGGEGDRVFFYMLPVLLCFFINPFSKNWPLGQFFHRVAMSIFGFIFGYVPSPCNLFQGLSLALDHMIRSRPLIGLSELCILDEKSEALQSHDGVLDGNAEEVHSLHHNLQFHDGLLDENAEEAHNLHHNLQSSDGLINENVEKAHNLHHNLHSSYGLVGENAEEVQNLQ